MNVGLFSIDVEVAGIGSPRALVPVRSLWVDTGSELTWVPGDVLRAACVPVEKAAQPFVLADGRRVSRATGFVVIQAGAFRTVDEVVFAEGTDLPLLGARTLEGFGAAVDPGGRRLVPAVHLTALCG